VGGPKGFHFFSPATVLFRRPFPQTNVFASEQRGTNLLLSSPSFLASSYRRKDIAGPLLLVTFPYERILVTVAISFCCSLGRG
jgi:hypothetical protein